MALVAVVLVEKVTGVQGTGDKVRLGSVPWFCVTSSFTRGRKSAECKWSMIYPPKGKAWEELVESLRLVGSCSEKGLVTKGN